jgi:uncharacterized membrane protein YccC
MNLASVCNGKMLASEMRREFMSWGETEGKGWIFVFKTTLAALLAMGISMRFELGQPATAMVTVYVIMQPQTGMVLTKNFYRVCGTLAGATASLVLVGLFSQERVLFLLGLSLWVGLCTAGATLYRNFKSYGFTLAGYTAAMIALPLTMQPTGFFDYAVNRVTEVVIGVICCGIVSGMVFPQSLGTTIVRTLHSRYTDFIGFVYAMLTGGMTGHEVDRMHLKFIGNILNLESFRGAVMREAAGIRGRDHCLRRLNRDFMAAYTTFHSLHQLLKRLKKTDSPSVHELIILTESLADVLASENRSVPTAEAAHRTARRLAEFRATFSRRTGMLRQTHLRTQDPKAALDCETALELLRRFVRELHDYTVTTASLMADRHEAKPLQDVRFASRTDPAVALLAGARAMIAVLLVAVFWLASAWPFGGIAVMMAAIGSSLFAPAPDPARAVKMANYGLLIAFVTAFFCKFFVMTSLDGFWQLCAGMAPFLLVGPYVGLNPKRAALGLGYGTMFCFVISPTNSMQYDPVTYINFGSALILGMAAAAVVFGVFAPVTGAWLKRRTARLLQRQMETACSGKLPGLIHRFESGMRDIPQRLAAGQTLQDPHDRNILEWMFLVLEIGRAVIHLRQEVVTVNLPQPLLESLGTSISSTADLFRRPDAPHHNAALESVEESIAMLLMESDGDGHGSHSRGGLRRILTSLHVIRTSLLDDETILAATVTGPLAPLKGASDHAA